MGQIKVDVIIRSPECSYTLGMVIDAISLADNIDPRFIIVNTGSPDFPKEKLQGCVQSIEIVNYTEKFSYSRSLNKALPLVSSNYCLIISSHTILANPASIEYAASLLDKNPELAAVTFSGLQSSPLSYQAIDCTTFTGFNGCWNTACLYRSALLRTRAFNEVVFAAEDLEWSRWAIEDQGMSIALLSGCYRINLNPRKASLVKRIKDIVSVGYYVRPQLVAPKAVALRFFSSLVFLLSFKLRRAFVELVVSIIFALSPLIRFGFKSGY